MAKKKIQPQKATISHKRYEHSLDQNVITEKALIKKLKVYVHKKGIGEDLLLECATKKDGIKQAGALGYHESSLRFSRGK